VRIRAESRLVRVAVDQGAAATKGVVAAAIKRQLRSARPDVVQRVARDDGFAGRRRLIQETARCHLHAA
jgi:hypothetical protein